MKLLETEEYISEIDGISRGDAVEGGSSGVANQPLKQLASRTKWLKKIADEVISARDGLSNIAAKIATKVAANPSITAGTKTKITYDSKGLVTAGNNLVVDDIPNLPWSKINSGKPTTLAGYGIDDAATAAQGTKADQALPASSFNPAAFATAAQGTKADAALPASEFNSAAFATAAQGLKADDGCVAQGGANTYHGGKVIKTKILTTTSSDIGGGYWEAKVEHALGNVMGTRRIVSVDVQVLQETFCELGLSHSFSEGIFLKYDNTYVYYQKPSGTFNGKNVMFTLRYVEA